MISSKENEKEKVAVGSLVLSIIVFLLEGYNSSKHPKRPAYCSISSRTGFKADRARSLTDRHYYNQIIPIYYTIDTPQTGVNGTPIL